MAKSEPYAAIKNWSVGFFYFMNYQYQLKHPKWQKKRLEILNRDNFTCQKCGDLETTLHIHHLKYPENGNAWDIGNEHLITLCSHCHKIVEILKGFNFDRITLSKITLENNRFILLNHITRGNKNLIIWAFENDNIVYNCDLYREDLEKTKNFIVNTYG